uniref:PIG-L family deacetylase n=1 Tax=Flavobacterium sp. TaxID=239 RepID=UPI00404B9630
MKRFEVTFCVFLISLLFTTTLQAQEPQKPNASQIFHQIQKLNFLGSVLYVAAHPDDENTRIISFSANHLKARTGYLSLTRGDGGQNLIGPELQAELGLIRTQELLEARKIDGGEQFFTRANDFGFSKIPGETLKIWNKEQVLSDMVYVIRKFKPDVIINRFNHRTPGTTHGHHTSSAMLSIEAFEQSSSKNAFENQLNTTSTWQPTRLFFNTSWWFYGSQENFDKANKKALISLSTGIYYPLLGKSNQEIAALSRSQHQSQGFGTVGTRGEEIEYLELIKGNLTENSKDIFEGINTTWTRVSGGKKIGVLLAEVEKDFNFQNPANSIPKLVEAYQLIQNLDDAHWKKIKTAEIKNIIAACAGLYIEFVAENQNATPGSDLKIQAEIINRSNQPMQLLGITSDVDAKTFSYTNHLAANVVENNELTITIPANTPFTQPYWLEKEGTTGMYRVDDMTKIGIPDVIRPTLFQTTIAILNVPITFERTLIYKYRDAVEGEVYRPFDIVPIVTSKMEDKVQVFRKKETRKIAVKVIAGKDNLQGNVKLNLDANWKVIPASIPFELKTIGTATTVYFEVTSPNNASEIKGFTEVLVGNESHPFEKIAIEYDHIAHQQILQPSSANFLSIDVQTNAEKIAYLMGAGDEVPKYLRQMGYEVTILNPDELSFEKLNEFDVLILGIRAFNTVESLAYQNEMLFDWVKSGKTIIVQYNTSGGLVTKNIAPLSLKISRDRVTEEDAEVAFLAPKHPVLNTPNVITKIDFKNWVQEQGLYFPDEWDDAFTPILVSNDTNESPKKGSLLIAEYGKGHYIYTGLSFFRELPAGVAGAYRLMANLISVGNQQNQDKNGKAKK